MRIHEANPHASVRMTVCFQGRVSAAEAGFLICVLYAALKRRSSTVLQAPYLPLQNQDQGQRQRTRASALHERLVRHE